MYCTYTHTLTQDMRTCAYSFHGDKQSPAFGKLLKGDEIVSVDGAAVEAANLPAALIGHDVPGSVVSLGVRRQDFGDLLTVLVKRVESSHLADKRRLFELFTAIENHIDSLSTLSGDTHQSSVDNTAHLARQPALQAVDDAITLWTDMEAKLQTRLHERDERGQEREMFREKERQREKEEQERVNRDVQDVLEGYRMVGALQHQLQDALFDAIRMRCVGDRRQARGTESDSDDEIRSRVSDLESKIAPLLASLPESAQSGRGGNVAGHSRAVEMLLSQFPAEEEVVRLEGEVRCLTKAGNELGLELQGLRDKEREFEREQAKLQQQLASALAADKSSHLKLENECARARQDLTDLQASFKSEKDELEEERDSAKTERARLQAKVSALEAELESFKSERESLIQQQQDAWRERERDATRHEQLRQELATSQQAKQQEIAALQLERDVLERSLRVFVCLDSVCCLCLHFKFCLKGLSRYLEAY